MYHRYQKLLQLNGCFRRAGGNHYTEATSQDRKHIHGVVGSRNKLVVADQKNTLGIQQKTEIVEVTVGVALLVMVTAEVAVGLS